MKYVVIVVLLLLSSVVRGDLCRTTGLIDIPIASVLPHGVIRSGASISFSEDTPEREENFNLSIGLFDRIEISLDVLSREAVEANLLWMIVEESHVRPAVAIGLWDITQEEHVSDAGFGSDAYADELAYGSNRPQERLSGFCVFSKSVMPRARIHIGFGRGKFVGWGPRSRHFHLGDEPESAVGLFAGLDAEILPGFQLLGEVDGRDASVGFGYARGWFHMGLGITKLEHLIFNSSEHSPRLVLGASAQFPLAREPREEVVVEELAFMGNLSGKVLDGETWEPVEALVKLLGTGIVRDTDRDNGAFAIRSIAPGEYVLEVYAPGYQNKTFPISIEAGEATIQDFFLKREIVEVREPEKLLSIDERVYFESNEVELTSDSKAILEKVARMLRENPEVKVEVRGYTDAPGSQESNLILSENRAGIVKAYLVKIHGIEESRLKFRGYGESDPVGDNSTRDGRSLNRRVEFRIIE